MGKEDPTQSHPWSLSFDVTAPKMQPSTGRRGRATRLSFMFANSKVWQKAACVGGSVLPSAKPLETPHVAYSQQTDGECWDSRNGLEEAEPRSLSKHS